MIKQFPEDFIVTEVTNIKLQEKGDYTYFWLKKKNYNTVTAVQIVAQHLHVKKIGYAGNKDKQAVTKQLCSVYNLKKERIDKLKLNNIELEFYGYGDKPISLGDLAGNEFEIVVRDEKINQLNEIKLVNYYDEQRFSKNNAAIGKAIIKKDFKKAVELIAEGNGRYNEDVKDYISNNKNDCVGALKIVPKKILMLFIHSFQSYYWNQCAAEYVKKHDKNCKEMPYSLGQFVFGDAPDIEIPLISFDTEFGDKELEQIYSKLLGKDSLTLRDFIIRQLPEVNPVSHPRKLFVETKINYQQMDKNALLLKFTLPAGSYATLVVKYLRVL